MIETIIGLISVLAGLFGLWLKSRPAALEKTKTEKIIEEMMRLKEKRDEAIAKGNSKSITVFNDAIISQSRLLKKKLRARSNNSKR